MFAQAIFRLFNISDKKKLKFGKLKKKRKKPKRLKSVLKPNKLVWSVKNKSVKLVHNVLQKLAVKNLQNKKVKTQLKRH